LRTIDGVKDKLPLPPTRDLAFSPCEIVETLIARAVDIVREVLDSLVLRVPSNMFEKSRTE